MLIHYIFITVVVGILGYYIVDKVCFDIKYKREAIREDKEILAVSSSLYGPKYSFEYEYKWNLFKPNKNYLHVYKDEGESKVLLVSIPTIDIRQLNEDVKDIIDEKETYYLKPVYEMFREITKESILEEIAGYCLDASFYPKKYGASLFRFSSNCSRSCSDVSKRGCIDINRCNRIKPIYHEFIEIYDCLLKIIPHEANIIIGMNRESFKDLSIEKIVSAKYQDSQGDYIGKDELSVLVFEILLYIYVEKMDSIEFKHEKDVNKKKIELFHGIFKMKEIENK